MRILIIGHGGQLGSDMLSICAAAGHDVSGADFPEFDISVQSSADSAVAGSGAEAVINCAAYTAVDLCETREEEAFAVNAVGVANLARAAKRIGAEFTHFSTDYVFDGKKGSPYVESDIPAPVSAYGRSKLAGEMELARITGRHRIIRIAWLYGVYGKNFVKTIREAAVKRRDAGLPLKVVNDQFGSPTYTGDVCRQTLALLNTPHYGIFHCTAKGFCSWYDFAAAIISAAGIETELKPCSSLEYPLPAPRPAYSVLHNARLEELDMDLMLRWEDGFRRFLNDESRGVS